MLDRLKNIKHLCLDLDGTLYLGSTLFEFTKPFLRRIAELGLGRTFFTNNSSRSTRQYVEKLQHLGIDATERDLFSSTHCTLDYLREHHPHAKSAFVLGTPALRGEFVENGFLERGENATDRPDPRAGARIGAWVCQYARSCLHPCRGAFKYNGTNGQSASRSAAKTLSGCSAALATRAQWRRTRPSGPIQTVDRMTPTTCFPYIVLGPYAP